LKVLRDAGLVESTRRGTWAYYRVVPDALGALASALAP
jgi:DNA-binding transcriptional ArsR family regulator